MDNKESQHKRDEELANAASEEQLTTENEQNTEVRAVGDMEASELDAPVQQASGAPAASNGGSKAWIAISAVLAIVLVITLIKPPFGGGGNDAVAAVNNVKITKDKLYDELVKQGGSVTLDSMITYELITQEAEKAKVTVTDEDVQKELDSLIEQFGSQAGLDQALAQSGMTIESLTKNINTQVQIRKILEPKITVTDEQIKEFYDQNKDQFATPEQIQASHILVGTKQEAEDILKQLKDGADFAKLATEKSTDTNSAVNGGDLGFFPKGKMVAEFENAAFALKVDEISGIVESTHGFHIIKKTGEKAATNPTFEEKKEDIRLQLVNQQVSEMSTTWLEEVRASAKITNTLEEKPEASESPAAETEAAQ